MDVFPLTTKEPYEVEILGRKVRLRLLTGAQIDAARLIGQKAAMALLSGTPAEVIDKAREQLTGDARVAAFTKNPLAGVDKDTLVAAALLAVDGVAVEAAELTATWRDAIATKVWEDNVRPTRTSSD